MSFEALGIRPEIVRALKEMGISEPTEIQEKSIPPAKSGKDVIGISKTGSGKTAAFGIPILEKVTPRNGLQAIIIAPTRELVIQITSELEKFGRYMPLHIASVYGGVSINAQIPKIAHSEIVVGTPGRLLDHLRRKTLNLSNIVCFVLDEADKMVEMGFIEDVTTLLDKAPWDRQILLFGATISDEIEHIKNDYMHEPVIAKAAAHVSEEFLKQYYYDVQTSDKFSLLVHLLKKEDTAHEVSQVIVFCSTRRTVEAVTKNLRAQGVRAEMIHGKLSQSKRQNVLGTFNKGRVSILVASPVAARGLHIDDVTHIYNYDLAKDPQEYVHRIGRTARAGETGKAITLLSERDHDVFRDILRRYNVSVERLPNEQFVRLPFVAKSPHYHRGGGGGGGHRQGQGRPGNRWGGGRGNSYGRYRGR